MRCLLVLLALKLTLSRAVEKLNAVDVQDDHLNANNYMLTHSDHMIASSRPEQPANFSNGTVILLDYAFVFPERTGTTVAQGNFKASVICPRVNNWGCHGASEPGEDGNSTCLGCAGTVGVTVAGDGAWVASGDHDDCACSNSGVVSTPPTVYHARAANPIFYTPENNCVKGESEACSAAHQSACDSNCACNNAGVASGPAPIYHAVAANSTFYTAENNCTGGGNCSSEHRSNCDTNCACDGSGAASGPDACRCSCKTNLCNTVNADHTVTASSGAPPGQNCSCSASGEASGASQCGCSCVATQCQCSCKTNRCNTMNQNHTITANRGAPPGQNCSCSDSGDASGASQCGCTCDATAYTCACNRLTCGSQSSPDGKTFKSTGGTSRFGGGTCKVTASCSGGFYDGDVYTAYSTPGNVHPEIFLDGYAQPNSLLGGATPTFENGVFTFGSLKVQNLAVAGKRLTLKVHAGSNSAKRATSRPSSTFASWPTDMKIVQTEATSNIFYTSHQYKVNAQGFADVGNYTLYLLDSGKDIIQNGNFSGFNATVKLITGRNFDSTYCRRFSLYPSEDHITELTAAGRTMGDLVVLDRDTGHTTPAHEPVPGNVLDIYLAPRGTRFGVHVYNQVGQCFAIVAEMQGLAGVQGLSLRMQASSSVPYFRIVPSKIVMAHGPAEYGSPPTIFGAHSAPYVVQVDGAAANSSSIFNQAGLPNPLHVIFQDGAGNVVRHANCENCVIARAVRCTDSGASSASTSTEMYPTCSSVAQAECAGSLGGRCIGATQYLDTLTGTTTANMVNGTATFTDIQFSFVVGSGYKIQFTHNANGGSTTSRTFYKITDRWDETQIEFPNVEISANKSLFVRPYEIVVGQQPGGTGFDKHGDGIGDGVGNGFSFLRQPYVYLKGNGYDFVSSANQHGWTPVYASLKTCEGAACEHVKLSDRYAQSWSTPPFWNFRTQTGTADGLTYSDDVTYQGTVHATSVGNKVGMYWRDLKVEATASRWQRDVVLEFRVGPGGPDENRDHSTFVLSDSFDIHSYPDPPRNLRVHSYDELGFRVEFDPAPSSPAQPLSGFIIEVDVCQQDAFRCAKRGTAASSVCKADKALNLSGHCFDATEALGRDDEGLGQEPARINSRYALELGLGSDLTTAGGHTEEILIFYTDTADTKTAPTPGGYAAAHFEFKPRRTLHEGDELFLDFGKSYQFEPLDEFAGALEGEDKLEVSSNTNSSLTLRVKTGMKLLAGRPVRFMVSERGLIKIPPTGTTGVTGANEAKPMSIINAPVIGQSSSSRGDNCKGNIGNTTAGCVVKTTYVFPTLQDASTTDAEWTGALNSGGSWWKEVSGVRQYTSTGGSFSATEDQCKSGQNPSATNPQCALPIGTDWGFGAVVSLNWNPPTSNGTIASSPLIEVSFTRDRALAAGDRIDVLVPNLVAATGSSCTVSEIANSSGTGNGTSSGDATACERLVTEVRIGSEAATNVNGRQTAYPNAWTSKFDPATSILSITVGFGIVPDTPVKILVRGFLASGQFQNTPSPGAIDAKVYRKGRTTFIFKNSSDVMTYSTYSDHPTGTQVRTDSSNKALKINIEAGAIHSFRVYAFNERFRSVAATTMVQNRAIKKPKPPTHFSQIKQEALGLEMRFSNLMAVSDFLDSTTKPLTSSPSTAALGATTRIGIRFTPQLDLDPKTIVTVPLPYFTGDSNYHEFSNSLEVTRLFQDKYDVDGAVTYSLNTSLDRSNYTLPWAHGCKCNINGGVETPRTKFRVTRIAYGSADGAENYTSTGWEDDEVTGRPSFASLNRSIPAKQCGGCSCSDEGVVTTPPTIYNTTGNCTSCKCSKDGISSFTAPYRLDKRPGEEDSVVTEICSNCTCSEAGILDTGGRPGNCSRCMCTAVTCNCACPIFRKCECGCETYEQYKCGCRQKSSSDIFSSALWSGSLGQEALMLTVGAKPLMKGVQQTVWVGHHLFGEDQGLKKPSNVLDFEKYFKPYDFTSVWGFRNQAPLEQIKLNWVAPFPTLDEPRLGYVVQFTTDFTWKTSIRTVYFPDNLARGLVFPEEMTTLNADISANNRTINLTEAAPWILAGQHVLVDKELMQVTAVKGERLEVIRGRYETVAAAHERLANVSVVEMGATDPSVDGGISLLTPTGDATNYPLGARLFSSGEILSGKTAQVSLVSACGGNSTTCSKGCKCTDGDKKPPSLGAEFGNLRARGAVKPAIPTDVLSYPTDFRGRLKLGMSTATTNLMLSDQPTDLIGLYMEAALLKDRYIRVDDEIMKFVGANAQKDGKGVISVNVYSAGGGAHCTCTIAGVVGTTNSALGTTGCYCSSINPVQNTNYGQGVNCTADGIIAPKDGSGGGGFGFAATFSVNSGQVEKITITDPGMGYRFAPDLIIRSGGTTDSAYPCLVNSSPAMSKEKAVDGPQGAKVLRGQLGTTAAAHAAAAAVYGVQWAGSEDIYLKKPTKRYNFRIASYNSAGFSPFVYYDLSLRGKVGDTNKMLPQGNEVLELSLLGGGVEPSPGNLTVHFVSPIDAYDISKGKQCGSVVVLDTAGTRLTCRTPSWVGGKFDVVVTYKSGIFKNFDVGSGWVAYQKPIITAVFPAQLDLVPPKEPIKILVAGSNFGFDSADVTGILEGPSFTTEKGYELGGLPCKPLIVFSDKLIECTLTLKSKDEQMIGNIVIIAGKKDPVKSEKSPKTTEIKLKPQPVKVEAAVQADFTEVTATPAMKAAFEATFAAETANALGVPAYLIEILELLAGSVVVVFNILPDTSSATAVSPAALAVNLAAQAADPNSPLRQGSLTGAMTVSLPPGTAELAAASAPTTVEAGTVASYLTKSVPRSYSAWDMEICYDTCTYLCETGTEVPQMGGQDVLPGYRAQVCQSECMVHCGYARPITH